MWLILGKSRFMAAVFSVMLISSTALAAESTDTYLRYAFEAMELGLSATAEEAFRKVFESPEVRGTPTGETATFYLGVLREKAGDLPGAEEYFRMVVERFPGGDHVLQARVRLGIVVSGQGRLAAAIKILEGLDFDAVEESVGAEAIYTLALSRIGVGDTSRGAATLESFLTRYPDSPHRAEALGYLIISLGKEKRWGEITARMENLDASLPDRLRGPIALTVGDALLSLERKENALEWYLKAADRREEPNIRVAGILGAAGILLTEERGIEGEKLFRDFPEKEVPLELLPSFLETRGRVWLASGQKDAGWEDLERCSKTFPDRPEGWRSALTVIDILNRSENWKEVILTGNLLGRRVTDPETSGRLRWAAAQAAATLKQWPKEVEILKGLVNDKPPYPPRVRIDLFLGQALARMGQDENAVRTLNPLSPGELPDKEAEIWVTELAGLFLKSGRENEVVAVSDRYLKTGRELPYSSRLVLGEALRRLGKAKEAEQVFREALAGEDQAAVSEALFRLGSLLYEEGKQDEALMVLGRVEKSDSPLKGKASLLRASLFYDRGDYSSAKHLSLAAVKFLEGDDKAQSWYLASRAADSLERWKEARDYLLRIIADHSGSQPWYDLSLMGLAIDDERQGEYRLALDRYRRLASSARDPEIKAKAAERIRILEDYLKSPGE